MDLKLEGQVAAIKDLYMANYHVEGFKKTRLLPAIHKPILAQQAIQR